MQVSLATMLICQQAIFITTILKNKDYYNGRLTFKGLLYSPEVLGGIGLLTGRTIVSKSRAALPMLTQGMKTAAMFNAMEKEEEKEIN